MEIALSRTGLAVPLGGSRWHRCPRVSPRWHSPGPVVTHSCPPRVPNAKAAPRSPRPLSRGSGGVCLCPFPRGGSAPAHPHPAGPPGARSRIPELRRRTQGLERRELPGATWAESLQPRAASPRRAVPKVTSLDLRVRVSPGTAPAGGRLPDQGERRRARPAAPSPQRLQRAAGPRGGQGGQGEAAAPRRDVGSSAPLTQQLPPQIHLHRLQHRATVPARLLSPRDPQRHLGGHLGAGAQRRGLGAC